MTISFNLHGYSRSLEQVVDRARRAEQLGFDGLFLADSQMNNLDPFQVSVLAARETERLVFGTAVTNMVYRDPTVLASSAATANTVTGGRFVLGLGTGDGPVYRLGRTATTMSRFEEGVRTIRDLVNGRPAEFPTGHVSLGVTVRPVPVFLSVEGPKGLRVAGRVADGVILGSGFDVTVLAWARDQIEAGAREVGRDPQEIDLIAAGMIYVADDSDRARARVRVRLANRAHHNFRFGLQTVPEAERPAVQRFMDAFDITRPIEDRVPPELVSDYLVDRFAIAGTPEECVARIARLEEAGIRRLLVTPPKSDYDETMEAWGRQVMTRSRVTA